MRSWANRSDTEVVDEPFYAHYLQETGYPHPGADEVIAAYATDWSDVVEQLLAEIDDGKSIRYQKQMTHHMLEHIDRSWLKEVTNCFLIRDPRRMLLSFAKVIPNPRLDQLGLAQQVELFNYVRDLTGEAPPVISSRGVLQDPEGSLRKLCERLDVHFEEDMLCWPAGKHERDGVWAKHWYARVEKSTGFAPYQEDSTPVPERLRDLHAECERLYDQMAPYCIN